MRRLGVGLLALALVGCVPSAVKQAAREVGQGLPLYMQGVAPATTLTAAERVKVQELGRKLEDVARRLREAGE